MCARDKDRRGQTAKSRHRAASRAAPLTERVAIRRFEAAGLSWPSVDVSDAVLEALHLQPSGKSASPSATALPCTANAGAALRSAG